ncbi:MAG: MFS transporter [Myxococcales bacterium]
MIEPGKPSARVDPSMAASPPTRLDSYQRKLFVFLGVATFFEGFDYVALSQLVPALRAEYQLSVSEGGLLLAVTGFGAPLSYVLIRRADVVGRRRMLSYTIAGYTLFSLLSGFAPSAWLFGAAQLFARAFLLAEYALSMVYVTEEFPADRRGFAVGIIQGMNSLGSIVCAGLVPMLLKTPAGFRSVYFVGAIPLCILIWLRRNVRETGRFTRLKESGQLPRPDLLRIFRTPHRRRLPLLATIWSLTYMCCYVSILYWKEFAVQERGLVDKQTSLALMIAALVSLPLVFGSGKLLDAIGRKRGAVIIFGVASASAILAFVPHNFWLLTAGLTGVIFASSASLPLLTAFTLELFPTELRADGFGWANNLLGRIGYVGGPFLVSQIAQHHGYSHTIAATAIFPMIALVLILTRLPETGNRELEDTSAL